GLLGELVEQSFDAWPVEPDFCRTRSELSRLKHSGHGARNVVQHRRGLLGPCLCTLFLELDLLPITQNGVSIGGGHVTKDMRMAPDQLFAEIFGHIAQGEV